MTPSTQPDPSGPLLEVVVLHPRDAAAAARGGADRLLLVAGRDDSEADDGIGTTPAPALVSAVVRETDLPVRVLLRGPGDARDDSAQLLERALACRELGVAGFSVGFLDRDLEVDRDACARFAEAIGTGWGFHRGFDAGLDPDRAWRQVVDLPGIDAVASAGSSRGLRVGADELCRRAAGSVRVAGLLLASGGLVAEQVPWLVRAGVRQFGLGAAARPDGSWTKAYVDVGHVRTWRMLIDDALSRAIGEPVG